MGNNSTLVICTVPHITSSSFSLSSQIPLLKTTDLQYLSLLTVIISSIPTKNLSQTLNSKLNPFLKFNHKFKMLRQSCKKLLGQAQFQLRGPTRRGYHERVVDHYNNPRNVGSFDKNDPDVGTGLVGAPACGDVMKLQIRVDDKTGKITDARFKTFGCGSAIASSSVATEWVKGRQMEEVLSIKNTEIAKHLSLPPVKLHCSMLAEDAIKAAVKDYETKRAKNGSSPEAATSEKAAEA